MIAKGISAALGALALAAALEGGAGPGVATRLDAGLDANPLPPGSVAVCRVRGLAPQGLVLAGLHQEAGFYFSPADGCLVALLAVPLGTRRGRQALALRWPGGEQALDLAVGPCPYPRLRVEHVEGLKSRLEASEALGEDTLLARAFARGGASQPRWKGRFAWPLSFTPTVTSPFGASRVYNRGEAAWVHKGLDLRCADGDAVAAAGDGVVRLARRRLALTGGTVLVDHGYGLVSAYFHLSRVAVRAGQAVSQGTLLGLSGHSGLANGPHLHFELRLRGYSVDPSPWMLPSRSLPNPLPN